MNLAFLNDPKTGLPETLMANEAEPPPPVNWLTCEFPGKLAAGLPRAPVSRPEGYVHPYCLPEPFQSRKFRLLAAALMRHGQYGQGARDAEMLVNVAKLLDGKDGFSTDFTWEAFDQYVSTQLRRVGMLVGNPEVPRTQVNVNAPGDQPPYYKDDLILVMANMMQWQVQEGEPQSVAWIHPVINFRRARSMTGIRLMLDTLMRRPRNVAEADWRAHSATAAGLVRCVFRGPAASHRKVFEPLPEYDGFDPQWRTFNVVHMARSIVRDRAWYSLPIMADALQDAGCEDETVLSHLRGPGPHCRGCWVIDGALGLPESGAVCEKP